MSERQIAEDVAPESVWYVDEATWNWLQELLAEEPKVLPKLRELLFRPSVFDGDTGASS